MPQQLLIFSNLTVAEILTARLPVLAGFNWSTRSTLWLPLGHAGDSSRRHLHQHGHGHKRDSALNNPPLLKPSLSLPDTWR
ncbi:hypothetical protein BDW74DRAFT_149311 [Aspergillus multicolor]|uniref:uncharacterized protein n=1 Tax=Aspergillus multicolor TaxID=41759 RepID=UPI003CCDC2DE